MLSPGTSDGFIAWKAASPGAQSINRAAAVLRVLAVHGSQGASIADVAAATGLAASTTHRLLVALVDERLAERARGSRRYRLGMEIVALGAAAGPNHDLRSLAKGSLVRICDQLGHGAHLLVRSGYDGLCIDQRVPDGHAPTIGHVGSRAPLGVGAAGLALLAFLNSHEIEEVMAHNRDRLQAHPTFAPDCLKAALASIRRQGYATATLGHAPRMFGLAVPILDSARRLLASIGITTISGARLSGAEVTPLARILTDEAWTISRAYEARYHAESGAKWWNAPHERADADMTGASR
ncbi:IclR family transcriptional regulator [Sphingomonas naphthae]|uniref:IclR family transcriptional regulator n=1 Tax=Sphingomonas naphthae TaxID=1813468 RepID=A0ABY7TPB5_9SPHN|nr:IclR family transcriptional regulator [Sphingomonas naphthae]WCT74472.1 IclR family transcriptional regulator [Sphingomonas naphthae]